MKQNIKPARNPSGIGIVWTLACLLVTLGFAVSLFLGAGLARWELPVVGVAALWLTGRGVAALASALRRRTPRRGVALARGLALLAAVGVCVVSVLCENAYDSAVDDLPLHASGAAFRRIAFYRDSGLYARLCDSLDARDVDALEELQGWKGLYEIRSAYILWHRVRETEGLRAKFALQAYVSRYAALAEANGGDFRASLYQPVPLDVTDAASLTAALRTPSPVGGHGRGVSVVLRQLDGTFAYDLADSLILPSGQQPGSEADVGYVILLETDRESDVSAPWYAYTETSRKEGGHAYRLRAVASLIDARDGAVLSRGEPVAGGEPAETSAQNDGKDVYGPPPDMGDEILRLSQLAASLSQEP